MEGSNWREWTVVGVPVKSSGCGQGECRLDESQWYALIEEAVSQV